MHIYTPLNGNMTFGLKDASRFVYNFVLYLYLKNWASSHHLESKIWVKENVAERFCWKFLDFSGNRIPWRGGEGGWTLGDKLKRDFSNKKHPT